MNDNLTKYFEARQQQHAQRIADKWAALNKRQQRLVREAAVMGYVQGFRDSPHSDKIPPDNEILSKVLGAVDSFGDLYPFLAALPKQKRLS